MRYGSKLLFEDVTTTFSKGRKYGLTGPNGSVFWFCSLFIKSAVKNGASAGVCVGESGSPTKSATAGGDGRAGGDDVVHKINRQGLHGASGADDCLLVNGETGLTAQATLAR